MAGLILHAIYTNHFFLLRYPLRQLSTVDFGIVHAGLSSLGRALATCLQYKLNGLLMGCENESRLV